MANKALFKSTRGQTVPKTDAVNAAGGQAYALSAKAALARYAATGCLSNTYYVKAEKHLDRVLDLAKQCDPHFIAHSLLSPLGTTRVANPLIGTLTSSMRPSWGLSFMTFHAHASPDS